jgi:phage terminase large subunit GpA-like protein
MSDDLLKRIEAMIYARDHVPCPHCKGQIDMTDSERLMGHVTYWGEDEAVEEICPHCNVTIYLKERVERSWRAGRTPAEAADL